MEKEADDKALLLDLAGTRYEHKRIWKRPNNYLEQLSPHVLLHVFLVLCYTVGTLVYIRTKLPQDICLGSGLYSPARSILEYVPRRYFVNESFRYFGSPSKNGDLAWHDILKPMNTRLTTWELKQANTSSIALQNSTGHLVQLGVFHELHCLKILRHWLYKEVYHKDKSDAQLEIQKNHCDHCLQLFFDAARCKGDTALTTFRWIEADPRPAAVFESQHQCINWEKLFGWAKQRHIDKEEMKGLVSPIYDNGDSA